MHIGNDADLAALAEHIRGVARAMDNLIYLSGDAGVGGGVIAGGAPMIGASGYAGEVGHNRATRRAPLRLRLAGCWETEIGSHAVAEAVGCPTTEMHRLPEYLQPGVPSRPLSCAPSGATSVWASVGW